MKECDFNHLILYAKNWYKRSDNMLDDVRKIMAHRCAMDVKYMSDHDVWQCCVNALVEHATPNEMERFLGVLFQPDWEKDKPLSFFEPVCSLKQAVRKILSILNFLMVVDGGKVVLELGKPDPAILPLCEDFEEKWLEIKTILAEQDKK